MQQERGLALGNWGQVEQKRKGTTRLMNACIAKNTKDIYIQDIIDSQNYIWVQIT